MQVSHPNTPDPTPEELQHLEELKAIVIQSLQTGKLSKDRILQIERLIFAGGKVTYQELEVVRLTIQEQLGAANLEYEWD
jgi:hypothetical protein